MRSVEHRLHLVVRDADREAALAVGTLILDEQLMTVL
jgi:ABC-type branched-subunit amino acid transport system ATPase component